jgi:hypothetical protein
MIPTLYFGTNSNISVSLIVIGFATLLSASNSPTQIIGVLLSSLAPVIIILSIVKNKQRPKKITTATV